MIDLSTMVGRVISPTNRRVATARDLWCGRPQWCRRSSGTCWKCDSSRCHATSTGPSCIRTRARGIPVGTLFIQPRVDTRTQQNVLLDDVLGPWFAVLCWNNNPRKILGERRSRTWKALGARFIALRPSTQLHWMSRDPEDPDVVIVGDRTGGLKAWFDTRQESVLFLRPDRCIAGACIAQLAPDLSTSLLEALALAPGGGDLQSATGSVLYVAQPAAESTGAVADLLDDIDAAIGQARKFVEDYDPELVVIFSPDHYNGFFYKSMPPFCIGTSANGVGDYGLTPAHSTFPGTSPQVARKPSSTRGSTSRYRPAWTSITAPCSRWRSCLETPSRVR